MSRFCTNCGTSIVEASAFCNKCGTKCGATVVISPKVSVFKNPYARAWLRIALFSIWLVFFYVAAANDSGADPIFMFLMYTIGVAGVYFGVRRLSYLSNRHFKIWPWGVALLLCVSAYKVLQMQNEYEECRRGQFGERAGNGDYFFAPGYAGEMCSAEVIARRFHPNGH